MVDEAGQLAQELIKQSRIEPALCLVLGGADTAKTTLVTGLVRHLAAAAPTAVVDADVGQSHIGPPTTVAWARAEDSPRELSKLPMRAMHFVGDVTPVGHLLPFVAALGRACEQALKEASLVVIDTPGFIRDAAAQALWWQVQQLVRPRIIIARQRQRELESVLAGLEGMTAQIHRLTCPAAVTLKSACQRRQFRSARFAQYFRNNRTYEINLDTVAVQAARPYKKIGAEQMKHHIVALRDGGGCDRALAVVVETRAENVVVVTAPPIVLSDIRCVVVGDVKIDPVSFEPL